MLLTTAVSNPTLAPIPAVILGFGNEEAAARMLPGAANQFLLLWLLRTQPHTTTLFLQEGVYSALTPALIGDQKVHRIHRHDPTIDVDTLDTAFCALHELQNEDEKTILFIAHDRQRQRAV